MATTIYVSRVTMRILAAIDAEFMANYPFSLQTHIRLNKDGSIYRFMNPMFYTDEEIANMNIKYINWNGK
jgi:hypothetical protein